jgi:hypothetical protein
MLTPTAARWLDDQVPALEELTGHPVRSRYKLPKDPDVWPPADVAVLDPATFNTINQWALVGLGQVHSPVACPLDCLCC